MSDDKTNSHDRLQAFSFVDFTFFDAFSHFPEIYNEYINAISTIKTKKGILLILSLLVSILYIEVLSKLPEKWFGESFWFQAKNSPKLHNVVTVWLVQLISWLTVNTKTRCLTNVEHQHSDISKKCWAWGQITEGKPPFWHLLQDAKQERHYKVPPSKLISWEVGEQTPSLTQWKVMAVTIQPLNFFFLKLQFLRIKTVHKNIYTLCAVQVSAIKLFPLVLLIGT